MAYGEFAKIYDELINEDINTYYKKFKRIKNFRIYWDFNWC